MSDESRKYSGWPPPLPRPEERPDEPKTNKGKKRRNDGDSNGEDASADA